MSKTLLAAEEIERHLAGPLAKWRYDGEALHRSFETYGWKATLMVVATIGHLAEAAWHHPELAVSYARVDVTLNSHDAGGVTQRDVLLAQKIEDVVAWQPAREGAGLEGTPQTPEHGYIRYDR